MLHNKFCIRNVCILNSSANCEQWFFDKHNIDWAGVFAANIICEHYKYNISNCSHNFISSFNSFKPNT